ncbi:MAG: glycosyltransferase family 39 protein [Desulfosarcina sp.]|nr:glycosyltransferase family 39 protein [Desulfosarcina sp.]
MKNSSSPDQINLNSTGASAALSLPNHGSRRSGYVNTRLDRFGILILFLCLLLLILSVLTMAAVPPISRDALTHHLAIPKLWIENGGIVEIPNLDFSYYPMNLDLLYVIPLLFGNDIIPKYIHFLFALATAWLIYAYLRQRTTHILSLVGALLFLSTPVIVKLSISVYVDLGLIFFSWASIFYLLAWARYPQSAKHLIFSAIFCGLGLGTKYNGMIVLFLLTLFVPIVYIRTVGRNYFKTKSAIGPCLSPL